jgi:DNA-binding NarL/FixJ family response regulator
MGVLFDPLDGLTPHQLKIVRLAYAGEGAARIACALDISRATLRCHVSRIRRVLPAFRLPAPVRVSLTKREREIATLITEGRSNYEISTRLDLTLYTVNTYISNLYTKTKTRDRVGLTRSILILQNQVLIGATEAA